jgi:hypothetical protein
MTELGSDLGTALRKFRIRTVRIHNFRCGPMYEYRYIFGKNAKKALRTYGISFILAKCCGEIMKKKLHKVSYLWE